MISTALSWAYILFTFMDLKIQIKICLKKVCIEYWYRVQSNLDPFTHTIINHLLYPKTNKQKKNPTGQLSPRLLIE